jgi:excisionase family DNA binding protein
VLGFDDAAGKAEDVDEGLPQGKELLHTEEVAKYLGVGPVTVWRWCRDGSLPCLKIGRSWRIRRTALDEFLERSERSETLAGRLRHFLGVPDNVLTIAQDRQLMHRLDAAFFGIGEARGGVLIKYHRQEPEDSLDELREALRRNGLDVARLEGEGHLRFVAEGRPSDGRVEELRDLLAQRSDGHPSLWVNFNWEERIDLEAAVRQQKEITEFVEDSSLVVTTSVLEEALDEWPVTDLRQAQVTHSGTIWFSEAGLALSRVMSPPST